MDIRKINAAADLQSGQFKVAERRRLLKSAVVLVSAAGLSTSIGSVAWAGSRGARRAAVDISAAGFRRMRRKSFYFSNAAGDSYGQARLQRIKPLPSSNDEVEQFSLMFIADDGAVLEEGMYSASNWAGFPDFEVYLQPVPHRRLKLFRAEFALMR